MPWRRLLVRDHAAPESTLALTKAPSLGCERVRPLAWCSRPRNSTSSLAEALVDKKIEDFVRGLHLDAYLVGGAVRDELLGRDSKDADFVVPGVDYEGLHAALEPHGKVEELEVAGRRVGARLYPRDRALRTLAPAGIEFAPPRAERSTGPGRHDFEIVADPNLSIEDDMARRDFTVNAIARRLETGDLVDPFGGQDDLRNRVLRTVRERSFAEDPLRLVRGLRLISQLGLEPTEETLRQMREEAGRVRLVSGERVGGGLGADGLGELSKLLLGLQDDLRNRVLRTVRERSFAEDPLRLVRGLRLISQLGLEPTEETLRQMREEAGRVRLVSGERVGGGLGADGLGELSKLLLGL